MTVTLYLIKLIDVRKILYKILHRILYKIVILISNWMRKQRQPITVFEAVQKHSQHVFYQRLKKTLLFVFWTLHQANLHNATRLVRTIVSRSFPSYIYLYYRNILLDISRSISTHDFSSYCNILSNSSNTRWRTLLGFQSSRAFWKDEPF